MAKLRGYEVEVYEKRPDFRETDTYEGRSINLALSERGLSALDKVGLKEKVREGGLPMRSRLIHSLSGHLDEQPYDEVGGKCIYSIGRRFINEVLVNEGEKAGVRFLWNHKVESYSLRTGHISFLQLHQEKPKEVKDADLVVASDGAFSALRQCISGNPFFRHELNQHYIEHGYKELAILPKDGKHRIRNDVLHIWPRGEFMMIALPNLDGSFTVTLFMPFRGKRGSFFLLNF